MRKKWKGSSNEGGEEEGGGTLQKKKGEDGNEEVNLEWKAVKEEERDMGWKKKEQLLFYVTIYYLALSVCQWTV